MSNTSAEVTLALLPAVYLREAQAQRDIWERTDQSAAGLSALYSVSVDPSAMGNASKVAPIPPPRITVPTVPQFK